MGSADSFSDLPPAESPLLTLAQATPKERNEAFTINGSSWRGALTIPQYLQREAHLSLQDLTKDGGITWWILVDSTKQPDSRTILSSCETLRKAALLARDGKVEEVTVHGIGSVFCRHEFRGRGYAGRMMQELGKKLQTWQQEDGKKGVFSVLYSDIGKMFYAKNGWKPFQSSHVALSPISKDQYDQSVQSLKLPETQDMFQKDVMQACTLDNQRALLESISKSSPTTTHVALLADYKTLAWHHAREEFQGQALFNRPPTIKGAQAGVSGDKGVHCSWTRTFGEDPKDNTLHILRLLVHPADDETLVDAIAAVLRRAQVEAAEWDMKSVEVWNPSPLIVKAIEKLDPNGVGIVHREKHSITSLKWNGESLGLGDKVEWHWNEKYGWC